MGHRQKSRNQARSREPYLKHKEDIKEKAGTKAHEAIRITGIRKQQENTQA